MKNVEKALEEFEKLIMEKGFSAEVGYQMTEFVVTTDDVRQFIKSLYEEEKKS
jgi:hypothetical protein